MITFHKFIESYDDDLQANIRRTAEDIINYFWDNDLYHGNDVKLGLLDKCLRSFEQTLRPSHLPIEKPFCEYCENYRNYIVDYVKRYLDAAKQAGQYSRSIEVRNTIASIDETFYVNGFCGFVDSKRHDLIKAKHWFSDLLDSYFWENLKQKMDEVL